MSETIVLDQPHQINMYRLLALKAMLELEIKGLKRSRDPSAYVIIKREFHFKGNKVRVLEQFREYIFNKQQLELCYE
jgi:hypothetical protein